MRERAATFQPPGRRKREEPPLRTVRGAFPRRDLVALLLLACTSLLLGALCYDYGLVMFDEGHRLAYAERIASGERIYRDFWSVYAPAQFHLIAKLLDLFGHDLLVLRGLWVVVRTVTALLFFLACRRLLSPPLATLAVLLWLLVPGHWHKSFFVFFPVAGLLLVLRVAEGRDSPVPLGLFSGVALLFRYDVGVFTILLFWAMLLSAGREAIGGRWARFGGWDKGRLPPKVAAGAAWSLPFLVPLLFAFLFWGGEAMWEQVRIETRVIGGGAARVGIPYPTLLPLLDAPFLWEGFQILLFYAPIATYVGCALLLFRRSGRERLILSLFLLLALEMFNQVFWQSNHAHLLQAIPLAYPLFLYLVATAADAFRGRGRGLFLLVALGGTLGPFLYFHLLVCDDPATGSLAMRRFMKGRLSLPHARVFYFSERIVEVEETVRAIEALTEPDEPIFVFPHDALYYFLARRRNATRYDYDLPGMFRHFGGEPEERVVAWLRRHPPALFVYREPVTYLGAPRGIEQRFSHDAPLLWRYLIRHARLVREIRNTLIFRIVPEENRMMLSFMAGYEAMKYGACAAGVAAFSKAVAEGGEEAFFFAHLGSALLECSRIAEAQRAFGEALRRDPENARALLGMARLDGMAGRWPRAVARLLRLSATSRELEPHLRLGVAQRNAGDLSGSIATLERAAAHFPDAFPALEQLGRSLLSARRWAEAEEVFLRLRRLAGAGTKRRRLATILLASARLSSRNDRGSIARLLWIVGRAPHLLAAYDPVIDAWRRQGRFERALALLESGLSQAETRRERCAFLERIARLHESAGDRDAAGSAWRAALRIAPAERRNAITLALGDLLLEEGRLAEAASLFAEVARARPSDPAPSLKLAQALRLDGRRGEAGELLHTLAARFPHEREVWRLLGKIALESRAWGEARADFERLLALDPNDWSALVGLGTALRKGGELNAARKQLERAVALRPDAAAGHLQLGITLAAERRFTSARFHLQEAIRLDPKNVDARYRIALTYLAERRFSEARPLLEEVLHLAPAHAGARKRLATLDAHP